MALDEFTLLYNNHHDPSQDSFHHPRLTLYTCRPLDTSGGHLRTDPWSSLSTRHSRQVVDGGSRGKPHQSHRGWGRGQPGSKRSPVLAEGRRSTLGLLSQSGWRLGLDREVRKVQGRETSWIQVTFMHCGLVMLRLQQHPSAAPC